MLRVVRASPQVTAECVRHHHGELRLLRAIARHADHAVLLCYGCVLLRKLCHLSGETTHLLVAHGLVQLLATALHQFPDDAILQASACGALAVLAQSSGASKQLMLTAEGETVLPLVVDALLGHREYSNLTRQVQIYACEGRHTTCVCMRVDVYVCIMCVCIRVRVYVFVYSDV